MSSETERQGPTVRDRGPGAKARGPRTRDQGQETICVELLGVARLIAETATIAVPYPEEGTVGALVRELAVRLPALVGIVFPGEDGGLAEGFVLSLDGRVWTRDAEAPLEGATRALLLSNVAGGR